MNEVEAALKRARKSHLKKAWEYTTQDVRSLLDDRKILADEVERLRKVKQQLVQVVDLLVENHADRLNSYQVLVRVRDAIERLLNEHEDPALIYLA